MKILFILDNYKPQIGGVEILFENIINRLINRGYSIIVLTPQFCKEVPKYEKINENYEIHRVGHNRADFMIYSIIYGIKLAKEADIIHSTTRSAAIPSSIISFFSNKKVIITVHEIFGMLWYKFMGWKGFFYKVFEDLIFKFNYDKYLCVSNYTKNSLRIHYGLDDNKLITVYNGIDYNIWNKNNFKIEDIEKLKIELGIKGKFCGLFFGRPGISKGLEFFIKAIPEIVKKIDNFKAILLIGKYDLDRYNYIKKLIKELDIEKHIIEVPSVKYNELGNYILASDFVIIPSLVEGFGFSAAESCTLGTIVITTDGGALPEVVQGKISLITPGNSTEISNAVININQGKYINIPEKRFEWDDNINATIEIYKENSNYSP